MTACGQVSVPRQAIPRAAIGSRIAGNTPKPSYRKWDLMSVIAILRIKGNPADLERYAAGAGGDVMRRIAEAGKKAGATQHRFAGGDDEVLVVDEWPDEQSFQAFFASQPEIADVMRDGGAQGAPQISFYRILNTPDQF